MQDTQVQTGVLTGAIEEEPPAPLPFERRAAERWTALGRLPAIRRDGAGLGRTMFLNLIDESEGGLSAETSKPLSPGACLSIKTTPGMDLWREGTVLRCMPTGHGYRIAVAYSLRRAA